MHSPHLQPAAAPAPFPCHLQPSFSFPKTTEGSDGRELLAEDHVVRGEVGRLLERAAAEV